MDELTLNKRLVSESVERIWHDRRLDDLERFVTADFVDHSAPQGASHGADGFLDGVKKVLAAFPDAKNHIDDIFAEGDRVVVRWTMTGTNTGDGLGFSPTGRAIRFFRNHDLSDCWRPDRRALELPRRPDDVAPTRFPSVAKMELLERTGSAPRSVVRLRVRRGCARS